VPCVPRGKRKCEPWTCASFSKEGPSPHGLLINRRLTKGGESRQRLCEEEGNSLFDGDEFSLAA